MGNDQSSLLDIVIVNHNSTEELLVCLSSIEQSDRGGVSVVVVDNGSQDNVDRIRQYYPWVRLVKDKCNVGFARAANSGLSRGTADYAMIMNPDTVVSPRFFQIMYDFMVANRDIGIVGPKVLDEDGALQGSARSFPTLPTLLFGRRSFLTMLFPRLSLSRKSVPAFSSDGVSPMDVEWVSGACMLVRRDAIDTVGPFDERFFVYWEDVDWCRRMRQAGWRVVYFPQASIMHSVGVSSDKRFLWSLLTFHVSFFRYYDKYSPFPSVMTAPLVCTALAVRLAVSAGVTVMKKICITKRRGIAG